jgi:hypothetical protein
MKAARFLTIFVGFNASLAVSQLVFPNLLRQNTGIRKSSQSPLLGPNIPLPGGVSNDQPTPMGDLIISDVIGKERAINVFAGFTRDIDTVSSRLDDKSKNSTILAPSNSKIQALPRKPWEDSEDYQQLGEKAYSGEQGEDRAHSNLRRFVEAHIIPQSPWKEGDKVKTLGGDTVWWEEKDGKRVVSTQDRYMSTTC